MNLAFTILEEGSQAQSVLGNHTVAIMKVSETYDELINGLQDICRGRVYRIQFYFRWRLEVLSTWRVQLQTTHVFDVSVPKVNVLI